MQGEAFSYCTPHFCFFGPTCIPYKRPEITSYSLQHQMGLSIFSIFSQHSNKILQFACCLFIGLFIYLLNLYGCPSHKKLLRVVDNIAIIFLVSSSTALISASLIFSLVLLMHHTVCLTFSANHLDSQPIT